MADDDAVDMTWRARARRRAAARGVHMDESSAVVWAEAAREPTVAHKTSPCSVRISIAAFVQLAFCTFAVLFVLAGVELISRGWISLLGIGAGVAALIMVLEMFCKNPSYGYLSHIMLDAGAYQHVEQVRMATPSVGWHIQCYHIEHYDELTLDENGNSQTQHHTRRINTHSACEQYVPFYWEDISSPFPDIGKAKLTRLTFEKTFVFADLEAATHFNSSKRTFILHNKRDTHHDFHETFTVPGYEGCVLACKNKDDVPRWLSAKAYAGCSLLCCTIPYRIMFALVSWEIPKYTYVKRFYNRRMKPIPTADAIPVVTVMPVGTMDTNLPCASAGAFVAGPSVAPPKKTTAIAPPAIAAAAATVVTPANASAPACP
eukprot:SAG31_NODE_5395_length_2564_cov_1.704260_2_plen_375_part_00